jgi:4-hydroxy 2-oxovalerate aldolase
MELLLTSLSSKNLIPKTDYNKLNVIVSEFDKLQAHFKWGTNMPYMISGAYSLPQKDVMSWIAKNRFTTESIINALQNKKDKLNDNHQISILSYEFRAEEAIIIGGGPNSEQHAHALKMMCKKKPEIILIHAGTRFVELFNELSNKQYYCLLGAEGSKLQKSLHKIDLGHISVVLEPSPRKMGTILPKAIIPITYELKEISFMEKYPDSLLTIAFQLSVDLGVKRLGLFGLDGYDIHTDEHMIEVSKENQMIIDTYIQNAGKLYSLTPTFYQGFETISIYSKL